MHGQHVSCARRAGGARRIVFTMIVAMAALCADAAAQLTESVRGLIQKHQLGSSRISVVVMDADSGATLAAINPDERLIPASNMKLLTSGAALSVLGPDFVFRTEIVRDGGRVAVIGSGDPALGDAVLLREMGVSVDEMVDAWVDAIARSGAPGEPISELIIDDRVFDRDFVHPSWPEDQLNRWYCAQVSGLNFHTNVLSIYANPVKGGGAPTVVVEPRAPWLDIANRATTRTDGQNTIWASRPNNSNAITLFGAVRWAPSEPLEVTLHDPAMFLGRLLGERLASKGLKPGSVRRARAEEPRMQGKTVAVARTPMDVVLRRCNVNSHNLYAEALLKRIAFDVTGAPGSWESGGAIVRMALQQRLGPQDAASVIVADGSGMSRENLVSASVLARWLASFHRDERVGPAFIASLPMAQSDGSMRRRMAGRALELEIRAKTGYIRSVSTLSGYVTEPATGRRVVFSVLVNDFPASVGLQRVRAFQDDVAQVAHDWLAAELRRAAMGG